MKYWNKWKERLCIAVSAVLILVSILSGVIRGDGFLFDTFDQNDSYGGVVQGQAGAVTIDVPGAAAAPEADLSEDTGSSQLTDTPDLFAEPEEANADSDTSSDTAVQELEQATQVPAYQELPSESEAVFSPDTDVKPEVGSDQSEPETVQVLDTVSNETAALPPEATTVEHLEADPSNEVLETESPAAETTDVSPVLDTDAIAESTETAAASDGSGADAETVPSETPVSENLFPMQNVDIFAEGDADSNAVSGGIALFSRQLRTQANQTPIPVSSFVSALLNKVGNGYSQAKRMEDGYYDCSSLVFRCAKELGLTQNVPITTTDWDNHCKNMNIGDTLVMKGSGGTLTYQLTAKNISALENPDAVSVPGTIMVFIEPGYTNGHVAVSLGSFSRVTSGSGSNINGLGTVNATKAAVIAQLSSQYNVSQALLNGSNRINRNPNVWLDSNHLGTDVQLTATTWSGAYQSVFRVEALNSSVGVCVNNLATGMHGYNIRYVLTPVSQAAADPITITSSSVSDVTADGYTVTAKLSAPAGIREVLMATWTAENGQDDLIWHKATISGSTATCRIQTKDHGKQSGIYYTHIYATDRAGSQTVGPLTITVPARGSNDPVSSDPEIKKVTISNITAEGYQITAEISAPAGVKEVLMPTWTEKNGQDDLVWHRATIKGTTAAFYVPISAHKNESGTYYTHIYLYDTAGKYAVNRETSVSVPDAKPAETLKITSVQVTELSQKGYRVTAEFTAPEGIQEVLMPTWTAANGQDDLVWHKATVSGNTATFYVSASDHKNEIGTYYTHVYLYDKKGNSVMSNTTADVPSGQQPGTALKVTAVRITELTSSGYRVTAEFTAPADGVTEVLMPTWTAKNGQDDLVWHKATVSGNTATCYISTAEHNGETGVYYTHVYVYGTSGSEAMDGTSLTVSGGLSPDQKLQVSSVTVSELTSAGYRITAKFSAPAGLDKILMPTWTAANGQDDLVWHKATISGNTATWYIPVSSHNNESGIYYTHVYVYEKEGKTAMNGTTITVPAKSGNGQQNGALQVTSVTVSEISASGYRVTAVINVPAGAKEVLMPTWTAKNGQDDLVWHKATVSGNTATCYISTGTHKNEHGTYYTHVYLYDINGASAMNGTNIQVP